MPSYLITLPCNNATLNGITYNGISLVYSFNAKRAFYTDVSQIFLIDHCCTWRSDAELRYLLESMDGLEERLGSILSVDPHLNDRHQQIIERSWILNDVYSYQDYISNLLYTVYFALVFQGDVD